MDTEQIPAVCSDPVILDQWHVISALDEIDPGRVHETVLLDESVSYASFTDGHIAAWRSTPDRPEGAMVDAGSILRPLPVKPAYGYLWTSLGDPPPDLFAMPDFDNPRRRNMNAGSVMVATSAPRAVENFLDLAHFPYVHEDVLGVLPHTEVVDYDVEIVDGEIIATNCDFFVPVAALNRGPAVTRYRYRVPHPYCVMLYYDTASDPSLEDVIALFIQPMTEERVRAHNYMGVIDDDSSNNQIKVYQLLIFGQDKPILENQNPKRLPLDPRAETPIRADKSAIVYRRWLSEQGVTYGVIPAGDGAAAGRNP